MSENIVNVDAFKTISPEDAQRVIDTLKKLIKFGKAIAALTPTTVDDEVMSVLDKLVTEVEPFAQDGTVLDVLNLIIQLFHKNGPQAALQKVKELLG